MASDEAEEIQSCGSKNYIIWPRENTVHCEEIYIVAHREVKEETRPGSPIDSRSSPMAKSTNLRITTYHRHNFELIMGFKIV